MSGGLRILIRLELRSPGGFLFDDHIYNVIITAHGLIILFFVVTPVLMGGFGNYFLPPLIGAPDMAFPRMNNIRLWLAVAGVTLLVSRALIEGGAGTG